MEPISMLPNFLSKPFLVVGMPVFRAIRCLVAVIPNNLANENENPNFDINSIFLYNNI
uniref:hypothetical protein n=1 Tax=Flavobacterium sp. TaxID=239 RepID=UPI00404A2F53